MPHTFFCSCSWNNNINFRCYCTQQYGTSFIFLFFTFSKLVNCLHSTQVKCKIAANWIIWRLDSIQRVYFSAPRMAIDGTSKKKGSKYRSTSTQPTPMIRCATYVKNLTYFSLNEKSTSTTTLQNKMLENVLCVRLNLGGSSDASRLHWGFKHQFHVQVMFKIELD